MIRNISFFIFSLFCGVATAQTITFDSDDYKAVGVYDNWEQSPFRTGELKGNAAVVSNPNTDVDAALGAAPNSTSKVVALQRSHYGSNSFGVRIDLKEPFRVTKTEQYIHVMTLLKDKPEASRMMVIGLGKRVESDWSWQTGEEEQFWALTNSAVEPSQGWQDVVVSFKGFSYSKDEAADKGIDIYSLVIVPDVRSASMDGADWVAYFDEIVVDKSSEKRFSTEKYTVSFDKTQAPTRTDRYLSGIGLTVSSKTTSATGLNSLVYNDLTQPTEDAPKLFAATAGTKVQPTFTYTGTWMSGYVYVDWNNDGKFSYDIESNGKPSTGSEVVSYNAYMNSDLTGGAWVKSDGTTASNGNTIASGVPTFTIPADQAVGFYRMRYKVDWNCLDPQGNTDSSNLIVSNGGGIADIMLDVHEAEVAITANQLNGDVFDKDGGVLMDTKATYGKAFTIKMAPAPGFTYDGAIIKYGYNTDQDQFDANGNPRWFTYTVAKSAFNADDEYTIPAARMIGGQVSIEGLMVQDPDYNPEPGPDGITGVSNSKALTSAYALDGRQVDAAHAKGIVIKDGQKQLVK